jgi:hypothetical protein
MTNIERSTSSSAIDAEFCARALDEFARILDTQDERFAPTAEAPTPNRFQDATFRARFVRAGRLFCVVLSLFGLSICVFALVVDSRDLSYRLESWLIPAFAALGLFSWFALPALSERVYRLAGPLVDRINGWSLPDRVIEWSRRRAPEANRKNARRFLKKAMALVPYEAHYALDGSILQASRLKDGHPIMAWKVDLAGFAAKGHCVSGAHVTVVYRRARSILPAVTILHRHPGWIRAVLQRFEVPVTIRDGGN